MSLEEDLKHIDTEIRKLKIQYDLYFTGALPRPPTIERNMVNRMIKGYEGVHIRNSANRYIYNNLVNKFNVFKELWNKGVRRMEEGERLHPVAARAAKRAQAESGVAPPLAAPPRPTALRAKQPAAEGPQAWRVSVHQRDDATLRGLYENYVNAGLQTGGTRQPSFDIFAREIARQTAALKQKKDCDAVDFRIYLEGKKVKIKARPAS